MVLVGVIFFSLFLDIDGQSLRLRGPAINWWLECLHGKHFLLGLVIHKNSLTPYSLSISILFVLFERTNSCVLILLAISEIKLSRTN